jgi:hypothetical protein
MLRFCLAIPLSLFVFTSWASEPSPAASTGDQSNDNAGVVVVHFGDSTCITSYLPAGQRVEAVLNERLSAVYENEKIVSHNAAAGGDFVRRFLDSGRYKKAVKDDEMKDVPGWFYDNHPNANGVRIIADEEVKVITGLWPERLPTAR